MSSARFWRRAGIAGLALALPTLIGSASLAAPQSGAAAEAGPILRLIAVGQVLTTDGRILNYNPETRQWQDIDEAFRVQDKETHILPLPVPAGSIREMVTFGFLLTDEGVCWLYNLETDRWEKVPPPPGPRGSSPR